MTTGNNSDEEVSTMSTAAVSSSSSNAATPARTEFRMGSNLKRSLIAMTFMMVLAVAGLYQRENFRTMLRVPELAALAFPFLVNDEQRNYVAPVVQQRSTLKAVVHRRMQMRTAKSD